MAVQGHIAENSFLVGTHNLHGDMFIKQISTRIIDVQLNVSITVCSDTEDDSIQKYSSYCQCRLQTAYHGEHRMTEKR